MTSPLAPAAPKVCQNCTVRVCAPQRLLVMPRKPPLRTEPHFVLHPTLDPISCCIPRRSGSPGCKVQIQSMGSDIFQQGSKNRSVNKGQGIVMTWAEPINKQFALQPGAAVNSSHKYACALYCPFKQALPSVTIGPGGEPVKDLGKVTISQPAPVGGATKSCEAYQWVERILKIVPMATDTCYVDDSVSPPVPFLQTSLITPFGKLPPLAYENQSYIGFDASVDVSPEFDVDMDSIKTCKRQEEGKCPGDPPPPHPPAKSSVLAHSRSFAAYDSLLRKSVVDVAKERLSTMSSTKRVAAEAAHAAEAKLRIVASPTFPSSYVAVEQRAMRIAQGATHAANGDTCCSIDAPQCQVQETTSAVSRYVDFDNQRERVEEPTGIIVNDYKMGKSITVNVTGGVETCQE